jgi:[ribosomal protein S5]-alanine N-acetyltransferase
LLTGFAQKVVTRGLAATIVVSLCVTALGAAKPLGFLCNALPTAECRLLLPPAHRSRLLFTPPATISPMNWDELVTLQTNRLSLRSLSHDDTDDIFEIFSHPEVMRYWSTPPLSDRNAAVALIDEILEGFRRQQSIKWGIALQGNNRIIGTVTLFHPDFIHRRAEIGYGLGRPHWNKGYMKEALCRVLDHAFSDLDFHRIEADVDPRNTASLKTLERLGFLREGYLRQRWHVGGEVQDAIYFGLLRPDWEAIRASL